MRNTEELIGEITKAMTDSSELVHDGAAAKNAPVPEDATEED